MNMKLVLFYGKRDGGLYTPAADACLLPSAEAVACIARSAGGRKLKYLANERSHQSRRFHDGSATIATATPSGGGEMIYGQE